MLARLRSWWQKAKKPLEVFCIIVVCMLVIALLVVIALAYIFKVNVPGLRGKTLWDWLQLLIIPAVLAVGGYLFNYTTNRNERAATEQRAQTESNIAQDNQREAALQEYIDKMSELLLHEKLRESQEVEEVRKIARVRTLTVLRRLDAERKGDVLQFLHESRLINTGKNIISLSEANLSGASLSGTFLRRVNLYEANLSGADLRGANLYGAALSRANLSGANLSSADLSSAILPQAIMSEANLSEANLSSATLSTANLSGANLSGTNLSSALLYGANLSRANLSGAIGTKPEQLDSAKSLKGTIMPDGKIHM